MTDFLVHIFVKNPDQVHDVHVRAAYGYLSGCVGIFCNLLLFMTKFLVGMVTDSIAVMSDAFNNLSDAASSVISLIGVYLSGMPADEEHPYGHGRIEYISALIVSLLVLEVGWTFLKSSVSKIRTPEELNFRVIFLILLLLSVAVKLWMAFFNRRLGKRTGSAIMEATAADSLGDVLATGSTIISVILYGYFHINIDGWIGLAVSLVILWNGIGIARDTLKPLIGETITEDERNAIRTIVEQHTGILGTHDLLVHAYGPTRRMASIHVEIDNRKSLEEAHRIVDHIERQVEEELDVSMVIHVDPVETRDPDVLHHKELVEEALHETDASLHMHDFHMIREDGRDYLYMDLEIPYKVPAEEADHLAAEAAARIRQKDTNAECTIVIDRYAES